MTSYRLVKWNRTPCTGTDLGRKTSRIFRHILVTADSPRPPRGLDDHAPARSAWSAVTLRGQGRTKRQPWRHRSFPSPFSPAQSPLGAAGNAEPLGSCSPGTACCWSPQCVCVLTCPCQCVQVYVCVGTYVYGCVQVCERVCGTNRLHCLSHTHWEFSEPQGPPAQGPAHWQRLGGHDLTSTLQRVQSGSLAVNLPPRHFRKTESCSMHSFILPSFIQPWLLQQALAERQLRDAWGHAPG